MATISPSLSVKVIVYNRQGKILLLQRSQASKNNAGKWEFPGGKLDPGESFDEALLREVKEETELIIDLKGSFGTCESQQAKPPVVYLVMEAEARTTDVRLSSEHMAFQWAAMDGLEDIAICPQFRRIARRYAQEVAIEPRVKQHKGRKAKRKDDLFEGSVVQPESLSENIKEFIYEQERYDDFTKWLKAFLSKHVLDRFPLAEVGARPKNSVSFATKIIKKNKYKDPLRDMTDLVGARIILHLQAEVDAVCRWIKETFEIDKANSGDKLKELGEEKFGYRSVHYVVEMRKNKPAGIPVRFQDLKAEIQVRTIAQHAWSDIYHDRVYKANCEIPDYWKREANRISALLEAADDAFTRLVQGVSAFQDHMRQTPDMKSALRAIMLWDVVRRKLPNEPQPALRAARLELEMEHWAKAVKVVDEYEGKPNVHLLCAKGYALCKRAEHSHTDDWKRGIEVLEEAIRIGDGNIEPYICLGELLAPEKRAKALKYYEQAFSIDFSNPTVLAGYIRCKVLEERTTAFIPLLRMEIEQAMTRSQELAAAGADLPHALYRIAGFHLLLGRTHCHESLDKFALAVHRTQTPDSLVRALMDVSELVRLEPHRDDIECARRFLAAAWMAKFPDESWPDGVDKPAAKPLKITGSFIIVAGGCDAYHKKAMKSYGDLLEKAFADFQGTIISGGTREGISGLVGKLAQQSGGRIRAVGYLPKSLPTDDTATKDDRYDENRRTDGSDEFTAREPIQNWLDLLTAGINPSRIRLLGINGGNIAGLEYRMAVALGAIVGLIEGSGREAEHVINDWPADPPGKLLVLPSDPATIRAFLLLGVEQATKLEPDDAIDKCAKLTHEDFLEQQRYSHPDPVMQPWTKLRYDLQSSNRSQIQYMISVLRFAGFGVQKFKGTPNDPRFTDDEVRRMGELEHGRWNVERLAAGWKWAEEKDSIKKLSPYILPWEKLGKDFPGVQKYDLLNVRIWPETLAEIEYEVYRLSNDV